MDPGLARALVGVGLVGGLALAAWQAPAQLTNQPPLGPPPASPPPADGSAPQPAPVNSPIYTTASPPPPAAVKAPSAANATNATNGASGGPAPATSAPAKPPPAPPAPPPPARTPTAVMQVLDKITAETLQFEAPIGRPIRYKTLVMTVRVCETRGASDPQPRPSAYVLMDTRAPGVPGHEPPPPKRVFEGWMFANAPALHPLEHPIYDAWLVSCSAGTVVVRPPTPPPAPVPAKPAAAKPPTAAATAPVPSAAKKPPAVNAPVIKPPPPPVSAPTPTPADNSSTPPQ